MTSSSFLLVESRFPRRPPALCFRAPFRFPFFCWCSSALIESSSSSSKYSFETTRQMTKTKKKKWGAVLLGFLQTLRDKTKHFLKQKRRINNNMDELTHMCWALLFLFFSPIFFRFLLWKKTPTPNCEERDSLQKEARKKKRGNSRHTLCTRDTAETRRPRARTRRKITHIEFIRIRFFPRA